MSDTIEDITTLKDPDKYTDKFSFHFSYQQLFTRIKTPEPSLIQIQSKIVRRAVSL